jgi:hypothetical protein
MWTSNHANITLWVYVRFTFKWKCWLLLMYGLYIDDVKGTCSPITETMCVKYKKKITIVLGLKKPGCYMSARAQNNIQLLCVNINKTIIENMKIWIFFQVNRRSNSIWFNQLTNLKDFISHTCVFVLILNKLDTTPGFCF